MMGKLITFLSYKQLYYLFFNKFIWVELYYIYFLYFYKSLYKTCKNLSNFLKFSFKILLLHVKRIFKNFHGKNIIIFLIFHLKFYFISLIKSKYCLLTIKKYNTNKIKIIWNNYYLFKNLNQKCWIKIMLLSKEFLFISKLFQLLF